MQNTASQDAFIERVYDTALDPDLWPTTLKSFADMMGASGASLRWYDGLTGAGVGTNSNFDPSVNALFFEHYASCCPLRDPPDAVRRRLAHWVPWIRPDQAWLPREAYIKTEFYNDYMHVFDLDWDLSISLDADGANMGCVDVFRPQRCGAHPKENFKLASAVQPHLIRAFRLGRKLAGLNGVAQDLADIVEHSAHGLFILGADGRVRRLNAAAQRLLAGRGGLAIIAGRLTAANQDGARRLQELIGRACASEDGGRSGGSMALTTPNRSRPLSLTVAPLRAEHPPPFLDGPSVLVCVTDLEAELTLPEARLRDLFGLTPAESRVALALFEGLDPRQAADRLDLSFNTVRIHLARIFDKTQTSSQAELARLMMRIVDDLG